jgi:hypothetical protein
MLLDDRWTAGDSSDLSGGDAAMRLGTPEPLIEHAAAKLDQASVVAVTTTIADTIYVRLLQQGRGTVADLRARARTPELRRAACRDALLNWAYAQTRSRPLHDFQGDYRAYIYADPFTEEEVNSAAVYLKGAGLIDASEHDSGIAALEITHSGQVCVEQYHSNVSQYERAHSSTTPAQSSTNVTFTGNVSMASHSPGSTQASGSDVRASSAPPNDATPRRSWLSANRTAVIVAVISAASTIAVAVIAAMAATGK